MELPFVLGSSTAEGANVGRAVSGLPYCNVGNGSVLCFLLGYSEGGLYVEAVYDGSRAQSCIDMS